MSDEGNLAVIQEGDEPSSEPIDEGDEGDQPTPEAAEAGDQPTPEAAEAGDQPTPEVAEAANADTSPEEPPTEATSKVEEEPTTEAAVAHPSKDEKTASRATVGSAGLSPSISTSLTTTIRSLSGSAQLDEESMEESALEMEQEEISEKHIKEIAYELGLIKLSWPEDAMPDFEKRKNYPTSYYTNSDKEKLLLLYAENFRRQFNFIYADRKPLLLAAENECGIQKMVCTTIRPTKLSYPELSTWEGCAQFIADHVEYESLEKPTVLPEHILSPTAILERRRANAFELSTLLCSFLVGNYYNAYVVCGYATREVCFNDLSREENPVFQLLSKEEEEEIPPVVESKYQVKPPRDMRSRYLMEMEALKQAKIDEEERLRKEKEQQELEEFERPPPDELYALRIHSWVVVLPGTRDITEPFFIESATGNRCELDDKQYLGLESLWDHTNYWVNLQECSQGCKDLKFDLTDLTCWEHLLLGEPWETRRLGPVEDDSPEIMQEKHLDMPDSWVQPIDIPHSVFKRRYPGGGKQALYKKSKLERYAPYETRDGLISRATMYAEYEWESPEWLVEDYTMRGDLLEQGRQDFKAETIWQKFSRGREDCLKEHTFFVAASSVEDSRLMEFYSEGRIDGLERIEMHSLYLTQTFKNRRDRLFYRHVTFAPRQRGASAVMEGPRRVVLKLVEKYERDPSKPANEDIAVKTFAIADNEIQLKYHYDDERVTAQTRVFIKPSLAEMGDHLTFNPQLTYGYMVSPTDPFAKQLDLFCLLEQLLKDEEKSLFLVREIEDEVASILKTRSVELAVPKLIVSIFDKERNDMYREAMLQRDKQFKELSAREVEKDIDYLSPSIARLGGPEYLTRDQAKEVREETIKSFKLTMIERATYIQSKFEKASQALQEKHQWYEEEQDNLTQEEEEEYFTFSNEMAFYLHTLDIQLNRHKELAPVRYAALESFFRNDPRLAILYW